MAKGAGRAHAINVVTPIRPIRTWLKRLFFMVARATPRGLGGPRGFSFIAFPRWVIVKRDQWPDLGQGKQQDLRNDYMLFYGQYDGTWKQYIDAFSDGIPNGPNLLSIVGAMFSWPGRRGSTKRHIVHKQSGSDYYYSAMPGFAERDVKRALRVHALLRDLAARHDDLTPEAFALAYRGALLELRDCLSVPAATQAADERQPDVGARWAEAS